MSVEAMTWAMRLPLKPASTKFVLVALCDNVGTGALVWPSVSELVEKTSLDRKTVIAAIDKLEALGLLADTGERRGRTGQVKVYAVAIESIPNAERFQDRNSSDIPPKESRFSSQRVPFFRGKAPENGTRNHKEPSRNHQRNQKTRDTVALPDWMPMEAWNGWVEMRNKGKAKPTPRALDLAIKKLAKFRDAGHDPAEILDKSTMSGWTDLYEPKPQARASPQPSAAQQRRAAFIAELTGQTHRTDPNVIDIDFPPAAPRALGA